MQVESVKMQYEPSFSRGAGQKIEALASHRMHAVAKASIALGWERKAE